ncbi:unnamed protein product [Musa hybrid cultivar]
MLPPLLLYHLLRRRVLPSEVSALRPGLSRDLTADPPLPPFAGDLGRIHIIPISAISSVMQKSLTCRCGIAWALKFLAVRDARNKSSLMCSQSSFISFQKLQIGYGLNQRTSHSLPRQLLGHHTTSEGSWPVSSCNKTESGQFKA